METTTRKRRRWTAGQKRALVAAQAASGLSVAQFCRQRDVPVPTFYVWRRQDLGEAGTLIEVPLPGGGAAGLSVELPGAVCLRVSAGTDPRWLGEVVEALRRCGR